LHALLHPLERSCQPLRWCTVALERRDRAPPYRPPRRTWHRWAARGGQSPSTHRPRLELPLTRLQCIHCTLSNSLAHSDRSPLFWGNTGATPKRNAPEFPDSSLGAEKPVTSEVSSLRESRGTSALWTIWNYESGGQEFESLRARHHPSVMTREFRPVVFFASRCIGGGSNSEARARSPQKKFERLSKWRGPRGKWTGPHPPGGRLSRGTRQICSS
jgi:hypothetical protein